MSNDTTPESPFSAPEEPGAPVSDRVSRNIADVLELEQREAAAISPAHRKVEEVSRRVAQPGYLLLVLLLVSAWIAFNLLSNKMGIVPFDPPPFPWLQGLLTLIALLTATVVLVGQRRQMKQAEQRGHLDLQINLLTEQKVTKLIHLLEELRHELAETPVRHDPHVAELKKPTDAAQVMSALKKGSED
jgi:uncharacterized membrane protein